MEDTMELSEDWDTSKGFSMEPTEKQGSKIHT